MHYELNVRYSFALPDGLISYAGQVAIRGAIAAVSPSDWGIDGSYLPALPYNFDFVWQTTDGAFRGTFPRRVAQYYYKTHGIKLPATFLSVLGNLARTHSADQRVYSFDFTDTFNWNDGDFGDGGACLWYSNEHGRIAMEENGCHAIRFYDESDKGRARAWLYRIADDQIVTWNAYDGANRGAANAFGISTLNVAHLLATWWNVTYTKIALTNMSKTTCPVWINSGIGYVIAPAAICEKSRAFDLQIPCYDSYCYSCDDGINEDDAYHVDGEWYCQHCYYETFRRCARCGEDVYCENTRYVVDEDWCDDCYDHLFFWCEECHEDRSLDDQREYEDRIVCDYCHAKLTDEETADDQPE